MTRADSEVHESLVVPVGVLFVSLQLYSHSKWSITSSLWNYLGVVLPRAEGWVD